MCSSIKEENNVFIIFIVNKNHRQKVRSCQPQNLRCLVSTTSCQSSANPWLIAVANQCEHTKVLPAKTTGSGLVG
jgi:hypothetical protein